MANKKVEVDIEIKGGEKVKGLGQEIKELTKQLRQTPEGTKEWSEIFNKIDDLKDKLEGSKVASKDFADTLESAGGPLGMLGAAINKVKVATTSFGAAFKAIGIGLIVSAIGGLVAAFSQTEGSMKKLRPLMIQLEKLFGGLVEAFQPLLDAFLDLASKILPVAIDYIAKFYGGMVAFFTLIKEAGSGIGDILKGIFTFDTDTIKKGYTQLTGSWDKTIERYDKFQADFKKGSDKQTKTQKEDYEKQLKIAQDKLESQKKLQEAELALQKETALSKAETEQEKLRVEQDFSQKTYNLNVKNIADKLKLLKGNTEEEKNARKDLNAELINLDAARLKQVIDFAQKQKEIDQKEEDKRLESVKVAGETQIAYETFILEKKKQLYGEASNEVIKQSQKVLDARKQANTNEIEALQSVVEAGDKLTEEQSKRYDILIGERKKFAEDQLQLDITEIRFNADKNAKLNDNDVERLKKVAENDQLASSIRIKALDTLKIEAGIDRDIKLAALDAEKLRREQDGEDEIALAQYIADQKKLIEQGYSDVVTPLVVSKKELVKKSNEEEFNSFLMLGSAISSASQLFDQSSNAAKAFAAVQDLVNVAQQANIVITNLQALGLLQKASAEGVNTVATMGSATAEGVKSGAKLVFPANIIAIASIVGAMIGIFATIKKLFSPSKAPISGSLATPSSSSTSTPQAPSPINVVASRASGGMVSGAGTSTSDSILARVSNGEYVMNARSTSAFLPLLESMNNAGNQPQFAMGGLSSSNESFNMNNSLTDAISKSFSNIPIRTYVVGTDMSNQQQLDRTIKSRSLI